MNLRIARALLFEQSFRTMPLLLLSFAVGVLAIFAVDRLGAGTFDSHEISIIGQFAALAIAAGALFYSSSSGDRVTCEIPVNTLLLPVSTSMIVSVRYLWGAFAILVISIGLQKFSAWLFWSEIQPWWVYSAVALAAFGMLQAIAFGVSRWGDISLGVLTVSAAAMVMIADMFTFTGPKTAYLAASIAILVTSACVSRVIVGIQRRETTSNVAHLLRFTIHVRRYDTVRAPFKSPHAAQRWLETLRLCTSFPALLFGLLSISVLLEFAPTLDPTNTLPNLLGSHHLDHPEFFMRCLIGSAAGAGAIMAFLNFRLLTGPLRSFYFLRPMSTRDLASARLFSTIRILLVPLVVLGCWLIVSTVNEVSDGYFNSIYNLSLAGQSGLARATIHDMVHESRDAMEFFMSTLASAWMLFWTSLVAIGLSVFIILGTLFDAASSVGWIDDNRMGYLFGALMLAYLALMALMLRRAQRLDLLNKRLLNITLSVGFVLTLVLVGLTETYHWLLVAQGTVSSNEIAPLTYVRNNGLSFLFMLAFSALPFAAVPLTLHWNRHR